MRHPVIPILASLALFAGPAFAQTGTSGTHQSPGSAATSGVSGSSSMSGRHLTSDTEQRIRQSLEQSGFKNVRVMPEAFTIRAEAPDGSRVLMHMSPDQFAEIIERNSGTGGAANSTTTPGSSTSAQNGSANGSASASGSVSGHSGGSTAMPSGSASNQSGSSTGQDGIGQTGGNGGDISQQIRQSLQQNGFKDIEIMPEAFLIRGQSPNGSRMVMVVSPDQAEGVIAPERGSGSDRSHSSNGPSH